MATPRITIPELPPQPDINIDDLLVVQNGLDTKQMTVGTLVTPINGAIAAHVTNPADAHDATAISAVPNPATLSGTNVQLQLGQAAAELDALRVIANSASAHIGAITDAHDAAAVSVVPLPGRTGDNVQEVLAELSTILGDGEMMEVGPVPPTDTEWLWADTTDNAELNIFDADSNGLVPASGGGTVNYLRADGTFNKPPEYTDEAAMDAIAAALRAGTGISIVHNDTTNTITVTSTVTAGLTAEGAVDSVADAMQAGSGIGIVYDDALNTLTISSTLPPAVTTEDAVDATAAAFAAGTHTNVTVTYNDAANSLSLAVPPGITDGNKTDITVSGSGATWNINANAVGTPEIANGAVTAVKVAADVATQAELDAVAATITPKANALRTIVTYATLGPTGFLSDGGCYLRFTNPGAVTYTVPPNSSVAHPIGTQIDGISMGGIMTILPGSGVTINKARTLATIGIGSGWTLIKVNTDEWDAHGDFT